MRVILRHQTAFATLLQVSVPCSCPCAAAIPTIENTWENTNTELSKPNSIMNRILCRFLSVVHKFFFMDGNVGVLNVGSHHDTWSAHGCRSNNRSGIESNGGSIESEIDSSDPFAFVRATMNMFGDTILTGHVHHPQPHSSSHQGYVGH